MAAKAVDDRPYGSKRTASYARFMYLYFHRDWDRHFRDLYKALTYVSRYGRQGAWSELEQLTGTELWRRVRFISDAVEKEAKAAKG